MSLAPGTRFGPYEITGTLGAGGMGEVYRARDTNLKRDVAVKVLPASLIGDSDRISRLQREAEVLASLNHPNIAQIYGLERAAEDGGGEGELRSLSLIMELVEGPTLADRIAQGPIPPDEALGIAMQIIAALEAAHGRQVVHRDLKPANVKLTPDGLVKVLDFGIAKTPEPASPASGGRTPTLLTPALTEIGVLLGTAAYMAPEQARGKTVDQRADIWAFGCVLYEMLSGQPVFGGEDVTTTLARVLEREADLASLPPAVAPAVRRTIELCLEKDPRRRLHHFGDVRLALEGALVVAAEARPGSKVPSSRRARVYAAAAAVLAAAVAGVLGWSLKPGPAAAPSSTRFIVRTPNDAPLGRDLPLALSPNGRDLVFATGLADVGELFHLSLDSFEPRSIPGVASASAPFFSPQGDAIGFLARGTGELQRLDLAGGTPIRLVDSGGAMGASWAEDGSLVFTEGWGMPLRILRPGSGEPVDLTRIDVEAGEFSHLWPQVLPADRGVLFTIWASNPTWDEAQLAVADVVTGERVVIGRGASARYAESGHLVFWRGDSLLAAPFDLATLTVTGEAVRVVPNVRLMLGNGGAHFALSSGGTLAYVPGVGAELSESFVIDRSGRELLRLDESMPTGAPRISPDGTRAVMTLYRSGVFGVGVIDLQRGLLTPIAITGDNVDPSWLDNERVSFKSNVAGPYSEYSLRADGSGAPQPIFNEPMGFADSNSAWSPDGRSIAFVRGVAGLGIWVHEPDGNSEPRPLIDTAAEETEPDFSPDGRFIAYSSTEAGRFAVFVRPFPDVDARRYLISSAGGRMPVWSADGMSVFYATDDGLMEVPVSYDTDRNPTFGQPTLTLPLAGIRNYDVSPDGNSFTIERRPIETAAREIHVVVNWFDELKRLVPTD